MDQPETTGQKGHTRTRSGVKATRPRSSTKGPLEVDDTPLAAAAQPPSNPLSPGLQPPQQQHKMASSLPVGHATTRSPRTSSPLPRSPALSPGPGHLRRGPSRPKDFSFLLRPEIYHALTPFNIPPAFRNSPKQPAPDTSISDLLARGQFRYAAIAATQALTGTGTGVYPQPDPSDHAKIFNLLYTRLACLTLIDSTALAAQEAKAMGDLNSSFYLDEETLTHVVPWELRVLNVRLQAVGFGDLRRAVMSYYELVREARGCLAKARAQHDNSMRELWKERLGDLGVRVAGVLVEMGDLKGAAGHLRSLKGEGGKMGMSRGLLWLQLGDVEAARQCVEGEGEMDRVVERAVDALCDMADGQYESALQKWRRLREEEGVKDEMVGVNEGVCCLYVGRLQEGNVLLEGLVDSGKASHSLLFNLTTMYELCTERSRGLKVKLSEKVAGMKETAGGWEKTNADFKL
ncbi:hypothetical protein QBC35DRAFT_493144 [Podospora australis]|uniref:Uncharacterized protein n=1 Tax=Podospora australis TaxID=1536484 RepID=A0AAN6WWA0_9PEZI|nr:hypothetical protein QBC35DRAFT_493144 [Podospora australis]